MTTLEINLPEPLAREARRAGLLTQEAIERMIADALRKRAFDDFLTVADRVEDAGIPSMTVEEIETEIQAYRQERQNGGR